MEQNVNVRLCSLLCFPVNLARKGLIWFINAVSGVLQQEFQPRYGTIHTDNLDNVIQMTRFDNGVDDKSKLQG